MFRWLRDLWQSYTVEDVVTPPYEVVINNTQFTNEQVAQVFPEHAETLARNVRTIVDTIQGLPTPTIEQRHQAMFGGAGQAGLFGGYQQIEVPTIQQLSNAQQQLGQQQVAMQNQIVTDQTLQQQAMFNQQAMYQDGTYGAMRAAQGYQSIFGHDGLLNTNYDTFLIELKANGMEEPAIKNGDLLGLEPDKWKEMINKLANLIRSSPNMNVSYKKLWDTVRYMANDVKTTYKGDWGYDQTIGDYLIHTKYCNMALPLSMFVKLPTTMKECIEVMEKSLWSSRKSPITKKDIL